MRKHLLLFILIAIGFTNAHATHYRAGEILYRIIGNFKYEVSVVTYTKITPPSNLADRDTITIDWGDGTTSVLARVNGPIVNPPYHAGQLVFDDIQKNVYTGQHTYPGIPTNRFYVVGFIDPNRIDGINNIDNGNSVNIPFYVEDTIKFPTSLENIGFNSSPILLHPPIDFANVGDTFYHNPSAYDPDGDSLDFRFQVPLAGPGTPVPNYLYLHEYLPGPTNHDSIDIHKGDVVWAVPQRIGTYNIAILISEFRNGILLGTVLRDMQILVGNNPNNPPQINELNDTCVWAGESLAQNLIATDPETNQVVTLTATGGPFEITNPATFNATVGNPATGFFSWQTACDNIQGQPYLVVFRAADSYTFAGNPLPLVDFESWQIRVVPPPPTGLTATATPRQVVLNWDNPYACASFANFRGFSVWRKKGCDPFVPDHCETGLDGRDYTKLTNANIFTYTFTDNNVVVGEQYTYRILAHFSKLSPNGLFEYDLAVSVPSNGVCINLPISIPVLLNVSVLQTDVTAGKVFVRWMKPLAGAANLDTVLFPPPYRFDVYGGTGFNLSNPALIRSFSSPSYSAIADTSFIDTLINTKDDARSYQIIFYANGDTVGFTPVASSVFLTIAPSDQSLNLSWQENVPWTNDSFTVFKLNKQTLLYDSLILVFNHNYTDTGLINDSTYCYYIKAFGAYSVLSIPRPLINLSQEECGVPVDTVAPCPPSVNVRNDCDLYNGQPWNTTEYINYLSWTNQADPCAIDLNHYLIYYGPDSASMVLIDSVMDVNDTTYNHVLNNNLAGCYGVKAVDRIGNVSGFANIVCIDNCPYYVLPNTFTPNGDGQNEKFHPFYPYRFVPLIEMKIFNRWGEKVFETTDPEIGWDGTDQKSGKPLSEGVYLYAGFYYEQRLSGLVKKPLSPEKKGGGFIHLLRGK